MAAVLTRRSRVLVTAALMLCMFLAALDGTIVATAVPTIVGDLGGLSRYSWIFSAYLLTSTVTVPLYGRLADLFGRRRVLLFGVAVFLLGSALCGAAQSMDQLIAFRALQGIGAGAVLPIAITVVGDIYSAQQRARMQGMFAAVWGVASVVGPLLGGLLVDHVSWRWIFEVNLPAGAVGTVLLVLFLRERITSRPHRIDYEGTVLLTAGTTALLFALVRGGVDASWGSVQIIGLLVGAAVLLAAFVVWERRAKEPIIPPVLLRERLIVVALVLSGTGGMLMFGATAFLPLFVQGTLGGSATNAGLVLTPLSLGWVAAATIGGRVMIRTGYRPLVLTGVTLMAIGVALLLPLSAGSGQGQAEVAMVVLGLGLGSANTALVVSVQASVPWSLRGAATGQVQFMRTIFGALGVAAVGAVFNNAFSASLHSPPLSTTHLPAGFNANWLLDPSTRARLGSALHPLQVALADALHRDFLLLLGVALLGVVVAVRFPRVHMARDAGLAPVDHVAAHPEQGVTPAAPTATAD